MIFIGRIFFFSRAENRGAYASVTYEGRVSTSLDYGKGMEGEE